MVILIVDYIGNDLKKIKLKNIQFSVFNKKKILLNFRNHKKIVFIDNKILWIGGNNVGIEYLGLNRKIKYWNDFHCKIYNIYPNFVVENFNLKKKNNFTIKKMEFSKKFFFLKYKVINIINLLNTICKKKIIIMSPYLILDLNLINIIKFLNIKNIEIIFLISYYTDNYFIKFSSLIFIKFFNNFNIKYFFLKIGFFHRKIYVLDEKYVFFGSMNFDIRSIYINEECLFLVKDNIFLNKIFYEINKNFYFIINYKKSKFFLKFFYIVSFLNYFVL